jgi:hypothetical protein
VRLGLRAWRLSWAATARHARLELRSRQLRALRSTSVVFCCWRTLCVHSKWTRRTVVNVFWRSFSRLCVLVSLPLSVLRAFCSVLCCVSAGTCCVSGVSVLLALSGALRSG